MLLALPFAHIMPAAKKTAAIKCMFIFVCGGDSKLTLNDTAGLQFDSGTLCWDCDILIT